MTIPIEKHIEFYEHQIKAHEDNWKKYANTKLNVLINEKKLFIGRIWGISEDNGNVILRFRQGEVPRIKQPFFLGLTGVDFPNDPSKLNFSLIEFRTSKSPRYYSGYHSDINTINYWKTDNGFTYIIVNGFELQLLNKIKIDFLANKIHPLVILAETDPPVDYLINLKEFVTLHKSDPVLNIDLSLDRQTWFPYEIDNEKEILNDVIQLIHDNDRILIQGPPGTGKTFLVANICKVYLSMNKTIAVTALTNKALMEIVNKEGLSHALGQKKVFKTNVSSDEQKSQPKLHNLTDSWLGNNNLILTTYYKLSQKQTELLDHGYRFDLLIIEEASQAFLATLAMFFRIAEKILIIGDHKQLSPVVIEEQNAVRIHPKIEEIINGLKTFALNNNDFSYRLTKTRRLSNAATALTGIFYDNSLKSISEINSNRHLVSRYKDLFSMNCGNSVLKLPSAMQGFTEKDVIQFIVRIAYDILKNNKQIEVSLLTPYINIESKMYETFSVLSKDFKRITISTVHKIQGLTTDFTVLYLPLRNPSFDLNSNLFNVATSRAKRGTFIITYEHIKLLNNVDNNVLNFIDNCKNIPFESFKTLS